jgi:hypothetical protein
MEVQLSGSMSSRRHSQPVLLLFALVVSVVLGASPALAYEVKAVADGGSVAGVVKFENEFPAREKVTVDRDPAACGASHRTQNFMVDPDTKGLSGVVITILGIKAGKAFPSNGGLEIDQKKCTYHPHVQVGFLTSEMMGKGEESGLGLTFKNSDTVFHNVHTFDGEAETMFNLPSLPETDSSGYLKSTGTYHITCDLHSWMSAWVVVSDHPYVAVTGTDGTFSIGEVPPGEYKVRIWHEEMGEVIRDVVVKAGEDSTVDLRIGG